MKINFFKYQGTGNDFVLLDNRNHEYDKLETKQIAALCDRHFGIGADGLMKLNTREGYDFEMEYYNADGKVGSMCGNGGRCITRFAYHLGIHKPCYHFIASDGEHDSEIDDGTGIVNLKMKDVNGFTETGRDFVVDTGSPHYVKPVEKVMEYDVVRRGRTIRNSEPYAKNGINVNFVECKNENEIIVRTYERGVEDETFSCGTGVTAAALVNFHNEVGYNDVTVQTRGGTLVVRYERDNENHFTDIWLCGPADKVFEGRIDLEV